ncbi:MAG: sugar phosphate isomerase/epimerase [Clostridia bacterium]|nr:sugar phosphate isomerase/epimerase [Clostridia bacterium]
MKNCLAIWHYPHRTIEENIRFFAEKGFDAVSVHGAQFVDALVRGEGDLLAKAVRERNVRLTVHYALPRSHETERILAFRRGIDALAAWQRTNDLIKILSFDVPAPIRDRIAPYLNYVLDHVEGCLVAVEDFGLTPDERYQIEYLKGNRRFGYLIDLGHMFLRIMGRNKSGKPLFTNRFDECPVCENPGYNEFMRALASKEFPIFEMHLHNNDGENDIHLFLEDGPLDIPMIARVVRDIDFRGIMTIESAPGYKFECRGSDADEGILKTFAYWKECCQKK